MDKANMNKLGTGKSKQTLTLKAFVEYVKTNDYVTFAELRRDFDGVTGNLVIELFPNVIVWAGASQLLCDIVAKAHERKLVERESAHVLSYMTDGGMLNLPLVKRAPPKQGLKRPHWLPVCFRPAGAKAASTKRVRCVPRELTEKDICDNGYKGTPNSYKHKVNATEVRQARKWLRANCKKRATFNSEAHSYRLKHLAETPTSYVSNGALIVAALREGYRARQASAGDLNAIFNMNLPRAARR